MKEREREGEGGGREGRIREGERRREGKNKITSGKILKTNC